VVGHDSFEGLGSQLNTYAIFPDGRLTPLALHRLAFFNFFSSHEFESPHSLLALWVASLIKV
jgi:hypothetical protein